jgi:hypothetical protein
MPTLDQHEQQIEALEKLEIGEPSRDQHGTRVYDSDAQEACFALSGLSQQIRTTLWADPARPRARELADRADASAARIAVEHGLMPSGRQPRFPGYADSAGQIHEAID